MNRRSARLLAQNSTPISIAIDSEDDVPHLPPPKRRRISKPGTTLEGKKSKGLKRLTEMPLDILFEVFAHLHPLDLLHLGRSSKSLRALLFRQSAVTVWRRSLRTVPDLPPCPPQLTEPVYASVLFDGVCQFCGTRTPNVLWRWFIRACKACAKEHLYTYPCDNPEYSAFFASSALANMVVDGELEEEVVLSISRLGTSRRVANKTAKRVIEYLPTFTYPLGEYKRVIETYTQYEKTVWASEKIWRTRDLEPFATACRRWQRDQDSQRSQELRGIRQKRFEDIKARLADMGWAEEIQKLGLWSRNLFQDHEFVKQPKPLTEREWSNHKEEMVDFIRMIKGRRLKMQPEQIRHRLDRLRASLSGRRFPDIFPTLADIYSFPLFHSQLRHKPLWNFTTVCGYSQHMHQLEGLVAEWREQKQAELKQLLANRFEVDLAVVFFKCYCCTDPVSFPRILVHGHITERPPAPREEGYDVTLLDHHGTHSDWYDAMELNPWGSSCGRIHPHKEAMVIASSVISACGFNVMTTTRQDMLEADPYVQCLHPDCHKSMQWQRAILHGLHAHGPPMLHWRLLSPAERVAARKLESPPPRYSFKAYRCAHVCDQPFADHMTYEETLTHLNDKHSINEQHAQRGRDYTYHIDLDMDLAVPCAVEGDGNASTL